jgi:hypothetical protein
MAVISGRYGSVYTTDSIGYVKDWSLNRKADLYDSTNFDDSTGGRSYVAGFTDWSGSFGGFYSSGNNSIVPGDNVTLTLKATTTGNAYVGSAIIMGMDIVTGVDGLVTQAYTFQGTGALATST